MTNPTLYQTPPPMRGIKQAIQELRAADPNTALTEKALRRMVLTGVIPHICVGRKYLVNMDMLYNYLANGGAAEPLKSAPGIRRIAE